LLNIYIYNIIASLIRLSGK